MVLAKARVQKKGRFHHGCVRTMLRVNRHQTWKRKIKMNQLFADFGNRVHPLRT